MAMMLQLLLRNTYGIKCKNTKTLCTFQSLNKIFRHDHSLKSMTKTEQRLRIKDKVPDSWKLVYRVPMDYYCSIANFVGVGSLISFPFLCGWKAVHKVAILGLPITSLLDDILVQYTDLEVGVTVASFIGFNFAIWMVASRYILRIYSDDREEKPRFHVVLAGNLPTSTRTLQFESGELLPATGAIIRRMPWKNDYFYIKSGGFFLLEKYFRTPADFEIMMGRFKSR